MVKVSTNFYSLEITINGYSHLKLKMKEIYGYQSWTDRKNFYTITYYCKSGDVTCEYENEGIWKKILTELQKIDFN